MAKRRSKLKEMAAAGNPWAIKTLAEAQALGRAAAIRGIELQRARKRVEAADASPVKAARVPDDDIVVSVLREMEDDPPPWNE